MTKPLVGLAVLALLAGAALAYAGLGGATTPQAKRSSAGVDSQATVSSAKRSKLRVRGGQVDGLFPGQAKKLALRVRNRYHFKVKLVSVKIVAHDAGAGCSASELMTPGYRGHKKIRARRTTPVRASVKLASSAPDACQGATFPLSFNARATR